MKTSRAWLTMIGIALTTLTADAERRTPDPSRAPVPVTVPAGTLLDVRRIDTIDVDVATAGAIYKSALDDPVMIGGAIVIPRGARVALQAVAVKQSGRLKAPTRSP